MHKQASHRYILRSVIEFTTPFLVGSGREGEIADAAFVADANGLPAIPGSSLAGVLRSAFRSLYGDEQTERLFGFQRGDIGEGSRLAVSWGCIHDSRNRPVEGIAGPERLDDPVLAKAKCPGIRDHVKINRLGASDSENRGKFDEQAVCAGHRFTFEVEMAGDGDDKQLWDNLLALLGSSGLRLGGKTRRGFGAFKFVSLLEREFDLSRDFEAYQAHPVSLSEPSKSLRAFSLPSASKKDAKSCAVQLSLEPSGYWMFGGGYDIPEARGSADMAPVRDCRIDWVGNAGKLRDNILVVPGSGIKGALSHRVAFHYNALKGAFADNPEYSSLDDCTGEGNLAVRELFGCSKGREVTGAQGKQEGQRGRVIIDDMYIDADPSCQLVHHVGINRFTGGARDKVLFSERPLWQGNRLHLEVKIVEVDKIEDANVFKALKSALYDLAEGRLQIGAGSGRGLGYFRGTVEWPEPLPA